MYRSKSPVTYVFRLAAPAALQKADQGLLPKDYFYYYQFVREYFPVRSITPLSHPFGRMLNMFDDHLLRMGLRFDFPLLVLLPHLFTIRDAKMIFATTPKIGLGLALYKKLKLFHHPLIVNIVGLYDQLVSINSAFLISLIRELFSEVDQFVSGASFHETKMLSQLLGIPLTKFQFIPHSGIDTVFFSPGKNEPANFILGVGMDPARDWLLYRQIAEKLPQETFLWATDPRQISFSLPPNITVSYLTTLELKSKLRRAKLVLILTKPNHHFSGQASAMRAMSCAKTVILTKTPGVEEFPLKHLHNCVLVKPGDKVQIVKYIKKLSRAPHLVRWMGKNAARMVRLKFSHDQIGKEYVKLFKRFI